MACDTDEEILDSIIDDIIKASLKAYSIESIATYKLEKLLELSLKEAKRLIEDGEI